MTEITKRVPVYLCYKRMREREKQTSHRVIREGQNGDNFGSVRDIYTGMTFGTYGYNNMPQIGTVEIVQVFQDFQPSKTS